VLLRGKEIGPGFWQVMSNYHWPGNVRELLNILKRAGIMLESPITGERISAIIYTNGKRKPPQTDGNGNGDIEAAVKGLHRKLKTGENYWELVWQPFMARELDKNTLRRILEFFYVESSHSFKKMTKCLNVKENDYKKFMSYLYKYKLDPRKPGSPGEVNRWFD
jgi:DNA-binding NtrC family response regulator